MAGKVRNFSTLIENQLPEFISTDYPNFVKFVEKYYEQQESVGQPLDLIHNLTKYQDIDTYEKKILQENTKLISIVETRNNSNIITEIVINLLDGSFLPNKNGYVMIQDEVIFYQTKENNTLRNCYRNVSATTQLGDLYNESEYKAVPYNEVGQGSSGQTVSGPIYSQNTIVYNISNLFLYAFVKNFESQYLASFPEESLKSSVDKKTLIKNIKYFYQAKGTDQSIKFIFNSIVAKDPDDIPTVYYPKDYTFKSSNGEWINKYALKVKVLSGDVSKIIGQKIVQAPDDLDPYAIKAFAVVDNVVDLGNNFYEIILARETLVGEFKVAAETRLTRPLKAGDNIISVFSTLGWSSLSGKILINNEEILYKSKTVNVFQIENRGVNSIPYSVETKVYNYTSVESQYNDINNTTQSVKLIILGVIYDLTVSNSFPYSIPGDQVQESKTGFVSKDPIVYNKFTYPSPDPLQYENNRWLPTNPTLFAGPYGNPAGIESNVSGIFEDSQYYYIASSGIPGFSLGSPLWSKVLQDQKHLKIIKKVPSATTETTPTSTRDVGIAVNGVPFYSYKDYTKVGDVDNDIIFGGVTEITVTLKGKGYLSPPYVLIEEKIGVEAAKSKAILAGEVVDYIIVESSGIGYFPPEPTVTITSGRNATAQAVVTLGKVSSLQLTNSGEYYSSPPEIRVIDRLGKGKFAKYTATISNDGKITGFIKEDEGKNYTAENVEVKIIPVGSGASAVAAVKRWKKDRFYGLKPQLRSDNAYFFENINPALGYGLGYVGYPKDLCVEIQDNYSINAVPFSVKQHSRILGYAYDGNPIYGPYGYSDFLSSTSTIVRMLSSYELKTNRIGGPPISTYALGYFIDDYKYNHRLGTLDENNGRFCVTPEYPNGTYAYFITIDAAENPIFPYILGNNFYSIPVESNYNKKISQDDIPKEVTRIRINDRTGFVSGNQEFYRSVMPDNGKDSSFYIEEINSGSVDNLNVYGSHNNFSVGNLVDVDSSNTEGTGIVSKVSSIKGVGVVSLENNQIKAIQIRSENTAYLFKNDTLYQKNTNASGQIIGDVFDSNNIVIRNVTGTFNTTDLLYSNIKVINLLVNKSANFTTNSILRLTNGKQVIISNIVSNVISVSSNPFANNEPIIFSNTFSGIVANTIYYVKNRTINSFQISASLVGANLTLIDTNTPTSVAVSEKARALILETTEDKNNIKSKVIQGEFVVDSNYFLISSTTTDTIGTKISQINLLSENIKIFKLNNNIAIASTLSDHNLAEGDSVIVDISPSDAITTTTYYVRKRIYQTVKLKSFSFQTKIFDTGIGRLRFLNSGSLYAFGGSQTFINVEFIFADQTKCRDSEGRIVGSSNSNAVLGNVGGINNARATVIVTSGLVSNVVITSKGLGYKKGDLVTFSNSSLQRPVTAIDTRYFVADVDHVGFSFSDTVLKLNKVEGLSQNDFIKIGKEILRVNTIDFNLNTVSVTRGQESTVAIDHYNLQPVVLYKSKYNLSTGYTIGNTLESGIIQNYDPFTQIITIIYDLTTSLQTIQKVDLNYTFFDQSTPKKLISIDQIIEDCQYKFEFSKQNNNSAVWTRNPIIDIQQYYKYKFDTSNSTLSGSFLEFSPSGNYNILTLESKKSIFSPGSAGSFIEIKFGFGPFYEETDLIINSDFIVDGDYIVSGTSSTKKQINYTNYFYFDKNNIVNSDKSYLKVIADPLQGKKSITYVTPSNFVYELDKTSEYDGTGIITYTTTSSSAIGRINSFSISNPGKQFKSLPVVIGVRPTQNLEAIANVNWNSTTKRIDSVIVTLPGKNYSKPKAILTTGDGSFAEFFVAKNNDGSINAVLVNNKGKNYSFKPEIKIVETDLTAYFSSKSIGTPKNIKVIDNGYDFNRDKSISKRYSSTQILILSNFVENAFFDGEEIVQYENNVLIAKAKVAKSGWKIGSNVLRLQAVEGIFRTDLRILGRSKNNIATIVEFFASDFSPQVKSYYDNIGYYGSDRSNLGSESQRIADSYFYQDYSYTIKSKTSTDIWRNLIKKTTHPAGFKVFGEVEINTKGSAEFKPNPITSGKTSFVQLWDPQKNRVTVESIRTRRIITSTTVKVTDVDEVRGKGSAYVAAFDTSETISYEFYLDPVFNGYIDERGNRAGTKSFNMKIKGSNSLLNVSNINNLVVSLDGIIQEPGKAYTVSDSTLTFIEAPLGRRAASGLPVSGAYIIGVDTPAQSFIGRLIKFKDSLLNTQNFKKIKNISSQFNNVKTAFQLYYTDDTPVQLPSTDNLIVSIDGVTQRSGVTPVLPFDRAYYIRRTTTPNEIVFVEAPRKFEEIAVDNQISNKSKQSFFASNVGAYERLVINQQYIDDTFSGPFILRSAITGKTISVDDDRNVLVFVEEVLQKRIKSYTIRGANISFVEPLRVGQKINIMYLYGRNSTKFITMFDFDHNDYLNRIEIKLNYNPGLKQYTNVVCYQGNSYTTNTAIGTIKKFSPVGTSTVLTLDTQNKLFVANKDIYCINGRQDGFGDLIIPSSSITSIGQPDSNVYFEETEDTLDILKKTTTGWLIGSSLLPNYYNAIDPGDKIKIDGEDEYRNILSVPTEVFKTDYRETADVTTGYLGKISTTNYNGIQLGEGLDIIANVDTNSSSPSYGKVVSLSWNNKDYVRYETKGILPRPAGYSYENAPRLNFVPQALKDDGGSIISQASGGGAIGYVVVHNGEPIDVVLVDGGSGYVSAPKVYITRGYYTKRSNKNSHHRIITSFVNPLVLVNKIKITNLWSPLNSLGPPIIKEEIFTKVTIINSSITITAIIPLTDKVKIPAIQPNLNTNLILQIGPVKVTSLSALSSIITSSIASTITKVQEEATVTIINSNKEALICVKSFSKLIEASIYPVLYYTGALLQSPLSITDAIVYIVDTSKFSNSGQLIINKEIIEYTNKLSDRFYNITRGINGTIVSTHEAGAFVRQYTNII